MELLLRIAQKRVIFLAVFTSLVFSSVSFSQAKFFRNYFLSKSLVLNDQKENSEWLIDHGFKLSEMPIQLESASDIAYIGDKSKSKGDVLFYISTLRGEIYGWTRSKKLLKLGVDEEIYQPRKELPDFEGETGMGGICLSPDQQFLFTTGVYVKGWARINKVTRWKIDAQGSLSKDIELKEVFEKDTTGNAHQIGHCLVDHEGHLWFGTGDGHIDENSHRLTSSNGKIFRTNLNFEGVLSNPFFNSEKPSSLESLIYSSGFRNPWALDLVGGQLFVADNGPSIDRLIKVQKGKDYPWDGKDSSMLFGNEMVFHRALGPSDLLYVPEDHPVERLRGHLLMLVSHKTSVLAIPVNDGGVRSTPWWLVQPRRFHKNRRQDFSGLALGKDAVYITHLRMDRVNQRLLPAPILKIEARTEADSSTEAIKYTGEQLLEVAGCRSCHAVAGWGGEMGPDLDNIAERLEARLEDSAYLKQLEKIHSRNDGPESLPVEVKKIRQQIIDQEGSLEDRMRLWIKAKVLFPQFEKTESGMAKLDISLGDADKLAAYLIKIGSDKLGGQKIKNLSYRLQRELEKNPRIPIIVVGILALFLGIFLRKIVVFIVKRIRKQA